MITYLLKCGRLGILAVTPFVFIFVLGFAIYRINFLNNSVETLGDVTEIVKIGETYRTKYIFKDSSGKQHEKTTTLGTNPARFSTGEKIKILYSIDDTTNSTPNTFLDLWMPPVFFFVMGLFAILLYFILGWLQTKIKKKPNESLQPTAFSGG